MYFILKWVLFKENSQNLDSEHLRHKTVLLCDFSLGLSFLRSRNGQKGMLLIRFCIFKLLQQISTVTGVCTGPFTLVNERGLCCLLYIIILLNIFLLGWFCKPFCWRWCDWGRISTRRNSFLNQPRTDCIEAHHWSLGSQWMSHHHRLVFAENVSHLIMVLENIVQVEV